MTIFLICLKIFFARIIDVCLGAFRTVNVVKGHRFTAAAIAFVEVLIWYAVAREVLTPSYSSIFIPISYAGGYAMGTYLGTFLSSLFMKGFLTIHVISDKITDEDVKLIKEEGFGVSTLNTIDNKLMLIIEIKNKRLDRLRKLIKEMDLEAFMIINETKYVNNGFIK
ncbi:MAG: DUF5698 domain-containing protein [Bacilli bacterium]|nr:DUF5698 domain-containing protein [Bacilli bacterium]